MDLIDQWTKLLANLKNHPDKSISLTTSLSEMVL